MYKKFTKIILTFITLLFAQHISAQHKVSGKVSNPDGNPLEAVTIEVVDKGAQAITDEAGFYTIPAEIGDTLEFSFIGLNSIQRKVDPSGNINIKMLLGEDEKLKDIEVVAVAYGAQKKESITGSVSAIDKKVLEQVQTPNILKSLEGTVSGLQIMQGSGQPGSGVSSAGIRGIGSISASIAPLIIVDGVAFSGDLNSINSNDIEQISVLKDAASTALYGHRGANGVIIVTTKKGKKGGLSISLDSRTGFNQRMLPQYDIITDPKEYYETYWTVMRNGYILNNQKTKEEAGKTASDSLITKLRYNIYDVPNKELVDPKTGKLNPNAKLRYKDDWDNELFKNKLRQEHFLSIRGGDLTTRYIFSLGYLKDEGIVANSGFDRISARIGLDQDLRKWLTIGGAFSYTNIVQNSARESEGYGNAFSWVRETAPIYPIYARDAQGNFVYDHAGNKIYDWGKGETTNPDGSKTERDYKKRANPIGSYNLDRNKKTRDNFRGNLNTKIKLSKDFEWTYAFTAELSNYNHSRFRIPLGGDAAGAKGRGTVTSSREFNQTHQTFLRWNKKQQNHNLNALIGAESQSLSYSYLKGNKENYVLSGGYVLDFAGKIMGIDNFERDYKTRYFLSKLEYDYASKYYASIGFSRGASSVFHKDKRWGNFYGIGAAWRITQEPFMATAKNWLNELKFKVSYGKKGNDAIFYNNTSIRNYYAYRDQYKATAADGVIGLSIFQIGNPDLSWEKKRELNIGLEFGLFNRRITGSIDYYINTTSDLLYNKPQQPSTGKPYLPMNIGKLENRGIDLQLGIGIIQTPNVDWQLNMTASHYKNKILALDPSIKDGVIDGNYKLTVGRSVKDYYIRSFAGVDPKTGQALYWMDDNEGNKTKTAKHAEATRYFQNKTGIPDIYGGLQSFLRIKNFDFTLGVAYSIGGYILDKSYLSLMSHQGPGYNLHHDALNSWTVDNTTSDNPVIAEGYRGGAQTSNRFLIDASWFSISTLSLGYTLNNDWIKSYGISSMRLYAIANNVYLWSAGKGLDPRFITEQETKYPAVRTFSLGVKLDF